MTLPVACPSFLMTLIPVCRMLRKDKEEAEAIKHAKALEEEKAMYSVRTGSGWGQECVKGRARPSPASYLPYSRAVDPGARGESSGRSA